MLFAALPTWPRRLIRAVLGLVLILAVVLLLTWAALPFWIERQGGKWASEQLGRTVSLEAAHFSPWRLALTLDGVRIAGPDAQAPALLAVQQVEVVLSPRSVWHFAPILSALRITRPEVRLAVLGEGRTNVDDILARLRGSSTPTQEASDKEPPLALYNIELTQGDVQVDDRQAGMAHRLSGLQLGVPFLSTLDTDVEVTVQPHLAGQLNGVAFSTQAQAQPFARTRTARLEFKLDAMDLSTYRAYWPKALPMRLASGWLDAHLVVDFRQPLEQGPELKISGEAELRDLALQRRDEGGQAVAPGSAGAAKTGQDAGWEDWLRWKRLTVGLADVQPLKHQVLLDALTVQGPALRLTRDAQGRLGWPMPEGGGGRNPSTAGSTADSAGAARATTAVSSAPAAWRFGLRRLELMQGQVSLHDAAVSPAAQWRLDGLHVKGNGLNWPLARQAAPVELSATLQAAGLPSTPSAAATGTPAPLGLKPATSRNAATATPAAGARAAAPQSANIKAKGQVGPAGVTLDWQLDRLSLAWLAPYLHTVTPLDLSGQLAVQGQVKASPQGEQLQLRLRDLRLSSLELREGRNPVVSLADASLDKVDVVPASQDITLGRLTVKQPQVQLARDGAGRWNWANWTVSATPGSASARPEPPGRPVLRLTDPMESRPKAASPTPTPTPTPVTASAPWRARLAELVVEGGQVQLMDQLTHVLDDEPVRPIGVQDLSVRLAHLDWDGRQLRQAVPVRVSLVARRPDSRRRNLREAARLQWDGQVALAPVRLNGRLQAEHLPLHWADPYLDPSIGIHLQRAEGSFKGDVSLALLPAGPQLQAGGDLQLSDLRLRQARLQEGRRRSAEDLLSWQALRLSGFKLQMAPAGVPDIAIRQASLDEFYARLIISEQGRLNLRDLRQTSQGQAVAGTHAASAPVAPLVAAASSAPATNARAVAGAASPPLRLSIRETQVNAGRVDFTDRFVKPNYTAQLTELTGTLGSFSAGSPDMAPLQLRGRVAGTGLLDINGQLNPSGSPLALDITASATDIELAPLSPYAGKYAGYAIERGKLSSRVHYRIDPSGQLVAENKIVLNQLSFGDRIDSPDATQLPVRLAVALLKDSNGVIDINLPVSGSINDPEFSVGGVVVKLLTNLLTKALTAPFSLLSGGGGVDMSELSFNPGTAALPPATDQALSQVAKVLAEKPSLQLSITGWVDPAGERRAAQAVRLEEAMVAERRRELRRQQGPEAAASSATAVALPNAASGATGAAGAAVATAITTATAITLDDVQRQRLLKVVYENAKLPNKPRNLLGLAKDIPAAEMRELLLDSYTVTDEQMRELALQRSVVVRDALITKGVPNARMFLASPKLHESKDGARSDSPAWQPKVDLALSTQ
ncbi:DUF748 domain-containing protein [Roseateles sp. SL47]|uniref:DUF748 domain-containing protein n=1 Tax=Roseateles sp. SL47 TaxID=2995138 RepID=UPI0022718C1E|nr:DUF748 domain-containing protein [Roseateles sp. SL47]WAC71826.1 DUF748 domain-containing protein [Roseateles sp. SL47]